MTTESTVEHVHFTPVCLGRCDGSRLSFEDRMIYDLLTIFQPKATKAVYEGKLYVNGERVD